MSTPWSISVARFLTHCRVECGLAPLTLAAYADDLRTLGAHLGEPDPAGLTAADVSGHSAWLTRVQSCAASTVKRHLATIRKFLAFCGNAPAGQVDIPKQEQRLPKPIQADILAQMIAETKAPGERLVLELLYGCGLRASELASAVLAGEMVRVRGKGNRDRLVPATPFVRAWLPKVTGRPCRRTIWNVVARAAARVGVQAHPHQLRHSFATHLLAGQCPINAISQMMGHESLATTAGYMALDVTQKRATIERYHPRERTCG